MLKVKSIHAVYHGIEMRSYLLVSDKEGVLIDSGSAQTAEHYINPALKRFAKSQPFALKFIINTHSHADHSGGNGLLKSKWGARILVHQSESRYVSNRTSALRGHFAPVRKHLPISKAEFAELKQEFGPSVRVDRNLRDGSRIEFGNSSLEVLRTPGHSKGSVSLYMPKERLLFLGDSVQGSGVKANFPTLPIYDDVEAYEQSMKRLRKLDVGFAFTGHPFLPLGKTKLRSTEYHRLVDASLEAFSRIGQAISKASRRKQNALEISRKLMSMFGWAEVDPVPVFVLESVEGFLRSRRWSQ